MDSLLSISSTKKTSKNDEVIAAKVHSNTGPSTKPVTDTELVAHVSNAQDVLLALQSQPSFETLSMCLKWLHRSKRDFNMKDPGPMSVQILGVLVDDILPTFWFVLEGTVHKTEKKCFVDCISSVTGLRQLVARLRQLNTKYESTSKDTKGQDKQNILAVVDVLDAVLLGDQFLQSMWVSIQQEISKPIMRQLLWKELVSLLASGKLLSTAAEAIDRVEEQESSLSWVGDNARFTEWLGKNISVLAGSSKDNGSDVFASAALILGRALSLGNPESLVEASFFDLLHGYNVSETSQTALFEHLCHMDKLKVLKAILISLDKRFVAASKLQQLKLISGSAALIRVICSCNTRLDKYLINWLACGSGGSAGMQLGIRRAVVSAICSSDANIQTAFEELLKQFTDKIRIQTAPILIQETCTQNLLLLAGRLHRADPKMFKAISRHHSGVSNRLAASAERPKFLGMMVGMAISELVDDPDKRLKFGTETINSADSNWYLQLTGVQDKVGQLEDLRTDISVDSTLAATTVVMPQVNRLVTNTKEKPNKASKASKIISIEEVNSDEEDNFPRYQKPDSDASDSDEDPTLINRNKPTPPVYIRDLITYLRDTENHDRHALAMSHASALIRRKTNYGTEVKDHIEDLAALFCGLKDEYDLPSWQQQRFAAMVAVIVAESTKMGKWFANMVFAGDFSIAQRASMLTALTMAARELAGYSQEDTEMTSAPSSSDELFPSKHLPAKYAKLYTSTTAPLTRAAQSLESAILAPIAARAADSSVSGLSILKTRTFSSRLAVEHRKKPINNKLSILLSENFFFPLTNRWRVHSISHGTHPNGSNVFTIPFLQAHLLKTLALLLAAAGQGTTNLPALTTEFWGILLSSPIRIAAGEALPVMDAVLFGLLTLLDVNGAGIEGEDYAKRRLAEECGEQLVETREWVAMVAEGFKSSKKGLGKEEERVKLLAVGVLIRVEEVVERYQRLLMGALAGV